MITCQTIAVDNATKRPFRHERFETTHTPESAAARQRQRERLGGEFINGWYVVRNAEWTEYQRFYEV